MKVYILIEGRDYDGGYPIGVYSSPSKAAGQLETGDWKVHADTWFNRPHADNSRYYEIQHIELDAPADLSPI